MELLHSKKLSDEGGASTQKYVDVQEIKDGVIVLKNGALRAILMISSVNFDLKSSDEQDAIINQYQNFLNSVDFPIEILINSRRFNINPYIDFLKDKESQQRNELLRLQISEYKNFIKSLAEISNIMSKFFYIVVPFAPVESESGGILNKFSAIIKPKQVVTERKEMLETYKSQLWQRVDHVTAGLSGIGLKIAPLNTEEIIELLFNSYNPSLYSSIIIKDIKEVELK